MTAFEPQAGAREGADGPGPLSLALVVAGRPALVVGAGPVAHRKIEALVAAGADVRVVAPELGAGLAAWRKRGAPWEWEERVFRDADVSGMFLAVAATGAGHANARVTAAARREGALVNVVDDPSGCDFFLPAVARRGPLQIAVSTAGRAPGLAAEIRRRLEAQFDEGWGEAVELVGRARAEVLERDLPEEERRALVRSLAALDIGGLLEEGGPARVEEVIRECMAGSD